MGLRDMKVLETTISDVPWHSKQSLTPLYSLAQVVELHTTLEKISEDTGRWNKSLATLRREQRGNPSPAKVAQAKKNGSAREGKPVSLERKFWCGWQESNPRPLGS